MLDKLYVKPTVKAPIDVQICWLLRRDMAEVMRIEHASFEYPWLEEDFLLCLRQRNVIGMVATQENRVCGFMIYELLKGRLQILNFAVSPDSRRQGVGTEMMMKLVNKLEQQRRTCISLIVRETNLNAQLFFKSHGFQATRVLRGHYRDTSEDAYVMQYEKPIQESTCDDSTSYATTEDEP